MRRHTLRSEPLGIRGYRLISRQAIWPLPNAARAGPALPTVQHLAELAGGDGGGLVGVGGCGGAEPTRLGIFAPAARLRASFAGGEIAGEIAGGERDGERNDQCDNG